MPSAGPDSSFNFEHYRKVILVLDTVDSVRLMECDEEGFLQRWHQFVHDARHVVAPACLGQFRKSTGDGFMLEFEDAPDAARAALELNRLAQAGNWRLATDLHIYVRIAMHETDYVADEFDIYGAGVNLASRLLSLAGPGDIVASASTWALLEGTGLEMEDMGLHKLRHVSRPAQVFRLLHAPTEALDQPAHITSGPVVSGAA